MKILNGVYDMQGSQTKCSVATCGQWLMNWMVQMETLISFYVNIKYLLHFSVVEFSSNVLPCKKRPEGIWVLGFFLAMLHSLWNLSSPTRDWVRATAVKVQNSNHWVTWEFLRFESTFFPELNHELFTNLESDVICQYSTLESAVFVINSCCLHGHLPWWLSW